MIPNHTQFFISFFVLPFLSLGLGAILPPFLYATRRKLALGLNGLGFLLYAWSAAVISHALMTLNPNHTISATEVYVTIILTPGSFLMVESLTFLLKKALKQRL